jgi:hypothetical protein
MRAHILLAVICAVGVAPAARATEVEEEVKWEVVGFTADGKYVLFRRDDDGGASACREAWLIVLERGGKRVISVPAFRSKDGFCEEKKPISAAAGKRELARLEQRFGAFKAGKLLKRVRKQSVLQGDKVRVALQVKGKLPDLPEDAEAGWKKRARVQLRLTLTRGAATQVVLDEQRTLSPSRAAHSEHVPEWRLPELLAGQLSGDGGLLAAVIAYKPRVFAVPAK